MSSSSLALRRVAPQAARLPRGTSWRAWRRFSSHRLALLSAAFLALLAIAAILAPLLAPFDPIAVDLRHTAEPPDARHWLGTDAVGRDVFSRLLFGARVSLTVGLCSVLLYLTIAVVLGGVAGYVGGPVDTTIMRLTDVVLCFPTLILILILVGIVGPSIWNVILTIGLFGWPGPARVVRAQVMQLRALDHVLAARSIGAPQWAILGRHILPHLVGPLTVIGTLGIGGAILAEAGLSFLGFGISHPAPTWGAMLGEAQSSNVIATQPWLWLAPGAAISATVLAVNFVGDGLRDAFDVRRNSGR